MPYSNCIFQKPNATIFTMNTFAEKIAIPCIRWCEDGGFVICVTERRSVYLWVLCDGSLVHFPPLLFVCLCLCLHVCMCVCLCVFCSIYLWVLSDGSLVHFLSFLALCFHFLALFGTFGNFALKKTI
jgi:hypothetical protein